MTKKGYLGLRLHPVRDKDIIDDLNRFRDKTQRVKEVYRRALAVENGISFVMKDDTPSKPERQNDAREPVTRHITKAREPDGAGKERVKANILQSF